MSKPAEYYKIRLDTLKELKKVVVRQVYETYYKILTTVKVNGKNPLGNLIQHYP